MDRQMQDINLYKQLNWPLERLAKNTCKIKSKNKSTINVMNSFEQ